jgi:hypothetical protein
MELQHKRQVNESPRIESTYSGEADADEFGSPLDNTNVAVSYGIHHGRYPIGGMRVRDARQALQKLINIDPTAVEVVNGAPVDDNQLISADVTMLAFVKPSAVKGAERITIEGQKVTLTPDQKSGGHSITVEHFVDGLNEASAHGLFPEPLPDNVKWLVRCHKLTLYILQLLPEMRWIKWLAKDSPKPFGPGAMYDEYPLATPYVVLKVPFWSHRSVPRIEVFYRNQPLTNWDGDGGALFWPNLYNVSVNAYRCTAWFCSQYLAEARARTSLQAALHGVVHHLFGPFNASSEFHEGMSTFSLCAKEKIDPRVTDVTRWSEASREDPKFVLNVNWKPTGLTVHDLIVRELKFHKLSSGLKNVQALGSILLQQSKPK